MKTKFKNNPELEAMNRASALAIAANVKKYRELHGMSQLKLSIMAFTNIRAIENAKGKVLHIPTINRIADALDISAYDLLEGI